jgi:hypothetical protein
MMLEAIEPDSRTREGQSSCIQPSRCETSITLEQGAGELNVEGAVRIASWVKLMQLPMRTARPC